MKKVKETKIRKIKFFRKAYLFQDGCYIGWYQWKEKPGVEKHKLDPEDEWA